RAVLQPQLGSIHFGLRNARRKFPLTATAPDHFAKAAPRESAPQRIKARNEFHQASALISAKIVMNYSKAGFAEENVERKILQPLRRIPPSKDRKTVIVHYRHVPDIGNSDCRRLRIRANDLRIYGRGEMVMFEDIGRRFGKHTLRKNHDSVVM